MIKLSVSQAARLLGVSRSELQYKINHNKLATHEGYLTLDNLQKTYPNFSPYSEQTLQIKRVEKIKKNAIYKSISQQNISKSNQTIINKTINELQNELEIERNKNIYYQQFVSNLVEKLAHLEQHCHQKDKEQLHQLQDWMQYHSTKH